MDNLRPRKAALEEIPVTNVGEKALRMRRYRLKLKTERKEQYDKMKQNDAERKKQERTFEKIQREKDSRLAEKQRKVWRDKKKKLRAQKSKVENNTPDKIRKKRASVPGTKLTRTPSKKMVQKRNHEVRRVQNLRLRVKLRNYTTEADKNEHDEDDPESMIKTSTSVETPLGVEQGMRPEEPTSSGTSRSSEYRAIKRAQANMPDSPRRKAIVIEKLCKSPRTREQLEKKGVLMTKKSRKRLNMGMSAIACMKKNIKKIKENIEGSKMEKQIQQLAYRNVVQSVLDKSVTKHHKFGCAISAYLKVRKPRGDNKNNWWATKQRKSRKDRLPAGTVKKAEEFYLSLEVSREVPNKKDVKSVSGEQVQTHIMTMTLADAYAMFRKKYPRIQIGLTSFKKLKPFNVRKVSETSHKSCLCQTCCNLALKIDALNKHADKSDETLKMKLKGLNKDRLADISMCKYDTPYPSKDCIERKCQNCSPKKLTEFLALQNTSDDIEWFHWEIIQVKNGDDTTKRVTSCIQKKTSIEQFCTEIENDLTKYPSHIFTAKWQHSQLLSRIDGLAEGEVMMLMDYSENYRCRFQNESQNAYFDSRQVTVHPFMLYYIQKSKDTEEENVQTLVKHPVIAISDDVKHDAFAVKVFERKVMEVLKEEKVPVSAVIKFSDGASAQYKGKNTFAHLSKEPVKTTHNYFETSHGKSPCDGLGAVVKNSCFRAVVSGKALIGNAEAAYHYCKDKLEHTAKEVRKNGEMYISKRNIIYIDRSEINREETGVKTVPGTRAIHSVRNVGVPFTVEARNLSCFCEGCLKDNSEQCTNKEYVDTWSSVQQKHVVSKPPEKNATVSDQQSNTAATVKVNTVKKATSKKKSIVANPASVASPVVDVLDNSDKQFEQSSDYNVGDYVRVRIAGRRGGSRVYAGQIVARDDNEVNVTYMADAKVNRETLYYWPVQKDAGWADIACIVELLSVPILSEKSTNSRLLYSFDKQ